MSAIRRTIRIEFNDLWWHPADVDLSVETLRADARAHRARVNVVDTDADVDALAKIRQAAFDTGNTVDDVAHKVRFVFEQMDRAVAA